MRTVLVLRMDADFDKPLSSSFRALSALASLNTRGNAGSDDLSTADRGSISMDSL